MDKTITTDSYNAMVNPILEKEDCPKHMQQLLKQQHPNHIGTHDVEPSGLSFSQRIEQETFDVIICDNLLD